MKDLPKYSNPITTRENINELQHLLVNTCIDYIRKYNLTDIDEINFSADGLKSSYEYGEWTPVTDSSIEVLGIRIKEFTSKLNGGKYKMPSRALIGCQY